ncbi:MAG TPA: insulinase family protein [Candidatus Marinimicrobia bacterium]|nr:insulinase family protein [Candidatus Neomarinimicrobiota bacterium]
MYLILSGDFNPDDIKPVIIEKFGRLKSGEIIPPIEIIEKPFDGREAVTLRLTPFRFGIMGFRTVPPNHKDHEVLDVIRNLFNNSSRTGLLDRLSVENKILSANAFSLGGIDHGGLGFQFLPKLVFQSFRSAENLVLDEINKVRDGEFDEEMLESIKLNMIQSHESNLESMQKRLWLILSTVMNNKSWDDTRSYPERVSSINKARVLEVTQKYFGDNYLVVRSKMGFPKKTKLEKPPLDPVIPKNTEAKSAYAQELDKIKPKEIDPRFVEFGNDVLIEDLKNNLHFYYTKNPINSIFTMKIQFGLGTIENPALMQAAQYLNMIGTKTRSFNEYKEALQRIGTKVNVYSNNNYFGFNITGFDKNLDQSLEMTSEFMTTMHADEKDKKKIKKLIQNSKLGRKAEKKDPATVGRALRDYSYWGEKSTYLRRSTVAEVKKMAPEYLIQQANEAMKYEADIFYTGNLEKDAVVQSISRNLSFDKDLTDSNSPVHQEYKTYIENTVYLIHDKKAVQSQIYLLTEGAVLDMDQRITSNAFSKYFGRGMASIVFQEIREFRSLAYSSSGYYVNRFHRDKRGYFRGYMGTQADKSIEAIHIYLDLLNDMPKKENRIDIIRSGLVQSINSSRPGFRAQGQAVSNWIKQGYPEDPNKFSYEKYKTLAFEDILSFYNSNIKKEPIVITVVTDKTKIDLEKLAEFGKVIEMTKKDIFN